MIARLAVSVGCPSGIGPEVAVRAALHGRPKGARVLLVGDVGALRDAAKAAGEDPDALVVVEDLARAFRGHRVEVFCPTSPLHPTERRPGRPGVAAGAAQLAWIDFATDLVRSGGADALVTGPVSKDVIARSRGPGAAEFRGHTEHLARRLRAREVTMAFATDALVTSLVTTHLPLASVPAAIDAREVARATFWTGQFVTQIARGRARPRIAVAALNPHAGEGGLLGDEERRVLAPGIARSRRRLARSGVDVEVEGPVPAETAFRLAVAGRYQAVVAMYHDQATIPMKLVGFGEAVNVSLGLPIIRTSVDHGTAYDRAGQGRADPRGMIEALGLAARLARS